MNKLISDIFYPASSTIPTDNGGETGDTLYNKQRVLDDIFWDAYQVSERSKFDFIPAFSWTSAFRYIQQSGIWYAERTAQHVVLYQGNDRAFWEFFLDHTNNLALVVLTFNIVTIVFAMASGFIRDNVKHTPRTVENLHISMAGYVMVWLVFAIVCWMYFFVRKYPKVINRFSSSAKIDLFGIWGGIYRITSFIRFISFLYQVMMLIMSSEEGVCYQSYMMHVQQEQGEMADQQLLFNMILSQIAFDAYQISLYSMIPFPWPWLIRICLIQFMEAVLRLATCTKAMESLPMKDNMIYGVIASLFFYYFVMTTYIANSFERNVRSAYFNIQDNKSAAKEKIHLVNMLSQHIKIPVQTLLQTFRNVQNDSQQDLATSLHIDSYIKQVYHSSSAMNQIVDDLLFLVKVEENRFLYVCKDEIKVKACLQEVIEVVYFVLQLQDDDNSQHGNVVNKQRKFALFRYHEAAPALPLVGRSVEGSNSIAKKTLIDKSCTKVLLYYSILAMFALLSQDKLEEVTALLKELPRADSEGCVDIFVSEEDSVCDPKMKDTKLPTSDKVFRIVIKANSFFQHMKAFKKKHSLQGADSEVRWVRGGLLESTSLICQKIADSFNGQWDITKDQVQFSLPCKELLYEEEDMAMEMEVIEELEQFSRTDTKQAEDEDVVTEESRLIPKSSKRKLRPPSNRLHRSRNTKTKAKQQQQQMVISLPNQAMASLSQMCYVYVSEKHSESLFVAFIQTLFGEQSDMYISRQLTVADLKVYKIVFVQSITACYQLRSLQFHGIIVLISEKLAYFDEEERSLFDYGLPWSYSHEELQALVVWLLQRRNDQAVNKSSLANADTNTGSDKSRLLNNKPNTTMEMKSKYFLIPPLYDMYDIYLRWRYVSPINHIRHQSVMLEVVGALSIVCITLQFILKTIDDKFYLSVVAILIIFSFRRVIHRYAMVQTRLVLRRWLQGCCVLAFLALIVSLAGEFIPFTQGSSGFYVQHANRDNFKIFLEERHGSGYRGMHTLFFMINWPNYVKYFAEVVPWPLSPIVVFMLYLRAVVLLVAFFRYFIAKEYVFVMAMIYLFFTLSVIMNAYNVEYLYRTGFRSVHELIMSKDFLDRCLQVTRWSLTQPLQSLQQIQVDFQAELHGKCVEQSIIVTASLHQQMSQLHLNLFLSKEFLLYLKLSSLKLLPSTKTTLLSNMKAMMVRDAILKVASHFVIDTADLSIKIYLCFHPRLTLVRMDEEVLLTVLGSVLRTAVRRIQERCHQDSKCSAYEHEIMIWVQPHELSKQTSHSTAVDSFDGTRNNNVSSALPSSSKKSNGTLKFTDIRTALITVVDTGVLTALEEDTSRNSLANILTGITTKAADVSDHFANRFLTFFHSPVRYRTGLVHHHRYTSYQQCGVPYLLCPDSHKMANLLSTTRHGSSGATEQVFNCKEASYRQYVKLYNEVLVEFSAQSTGISDEQTTQRLMVLAKGSQNRQGSIHILTNVNSVLSRYTGRNMDLFQQLQWHCKTYHPRSLEKLNSILHCEVLLIDVDCVLTTNLPPENNLNVRVVNSKQELDIRDIIHFIVAAGYRGSIVVAHTTPDHAEPCGDAIYGSTAYKLQHSNAYTDAFRTNLHVTAPLTRKIAKKILDKYESDFLSSL